MYCFTVYTKDTGNTKKSSEMELLMQQAEKKVSLFAGDKAAVYGDVKVDSEFLTVVEVEDVDNDFKFAKRKHMRVWINTGLYAQVWKAIAVKGDYADYDWSAKLVAHISLLPISPTGGFLANCAQGVECGFFDNLEVFSQTAFSILLANVDTCKTKTEELEGRYPQGQVWSYGRGPVRRNVPQEERSGRD